MGKGQVSFLVGGGGGPFKRTRKGRWVMDWYGTGKVLVWDGYGMGMGWI